MITASEIYLAAAVGVILTGLYGVMSIESLLRKLIAMNLLGTGIFMVYIAIARRIDAVQPDPVPHAMVLTGIVISVSATAFGLVLARRVAALTGRARLPRPGEEESAP